MKKFALKKGLAIKILIFVLLAAVFFAAWGYDTYRASLYEIKIYHISDETPYASMSEKVSFTVRVTKDGKPCKDHEISATCSKGQLASMLERTDEEGFVTFVYRPYAETKRQKAGKVTIELADLSNSLLIEVNAKMSFSIELRSPEVV
ncbi:MAG: hypothetical protein IJ506_05625 [Clostridia bacterium]|nr:hypothetical protein [Clostridia bacterium]